MRSERGPGTMRVRGWSDCCSSPRRCCCCFRRHAAEPSCRGRRVERRKRRPGCRCLRTRESNAHVGADEGVVDATDRSRFDRLAFACRGAAAEREPHEPLVAIEAHDERVRECLAHAHVPPAALAAVAATIVDEQIRTDVVVLATERDRERVSVDAIEEILIASRCEPARALTHPCRRARSSGLMRHHQPWWYRRR